MSRNDQPACRIWLISGDPGAGKTTIVSRIILSAKTQGYTVGGILTREIRSHGERTGFRIVDVSSEESAVLADTGPKPGPRVGKYKIDLKALATISSKALEHAKEYSDFIVCDEIGPMELFSPEFRRGVEEIISNSKKPCLCVCHRRLADPLIDLAKNSPEAKYFEVDYENRDILPNDIWKEIHEYLKKKSTVKN